MRFALALVATLAAGPAFGQAPAPTTPADPVASPPVDATPPAPVGATPPANPGAPAPAAPAPADATTPDPVPASAEGQPPTTSSGEPRLDPAYGGRPERDGEVAPAGGDDDSYVRGIRAGRPIVIRYYPDRSRKAITAMLAMAGAAAVFGATGLYFHLDSRSATDEVSADGYTGVTWSDALDDTYDRAFRSKTLATVAYSIGGAFLLATAITYIVTEPELETKTIHPHTNWPRRSAMVVPTAGGALVGGAWRF